MKRTELYKLLQSAGLHSQYLGYEYFADAVWLAAKDPATFTICAETSIFP